MLVTTEKPLLETHFLEAVGQASQPLINHPAYSKLQHIEAIRNFMASHVFAVWDFMSLVKSLQRDLTCVSLPWVPVGSANTRFLINEIVLGEESDEDEEGQKISHFELYLKAMHQAGGSRAAIEKLIEFISIGYTVNDALNKCGGPQAALAFTKHTFSVIETQPVGIRAAVFAFGREDLIPKMFIAMLDKMNEADKAQLATFRYYLQRHIDIDGGHHSQMAWEMTKELLGDDPQAWYDAEVAVKASLAARVCLWDSLV